VPLAGLVPDRMQAYRGARSNETRVESIQFAGDTFRGAPGVAVENGSLRAARPRTAERPISTQSSHVH